MLHHKPITCIDNSIDNGKVKFRKCYYDSSGFLAIESTYLLGKLNGYIRVFYPNGNIHKFKNYCMNFEMGLSIEYFPNKIIKEYGSYDIPDTLIINVPRKIIVKIDSSHIWFNNKYPVYSESKDGKWVYYYPNGTIEHVEFYNAGKETGVWEFFNKEGVLIKKLRY